VTVTHHGDVAFQENVFEMRLDGFFGAMPTPSSRVGHNGKSRDRVRVAHPEMGVV
jgi:hypothetical protein